MVDESIKEVARRLVRESEVVYLATNGENGFPQIRAVFNLRNEKQFPSLSFLNEDPYDMTVTITTNTSSQKVREMLRDPRTSVYYCTPEKLNGVQLSGEAIMVDDQNFRNRVWVEGWERYYPLGATDPDYAVLRIAPTVARGWATPRKFELVLQ